MKCWSCGAETMEVIGVHYDSNTGLMPIPECECSTCGESWDDRPNEELEVNEEDLE